MSLYGKVSFSVALTTSVFVAQPAFADVILPGRCHMGECWDTQFIRKELLRENSDGRLYAVELATRAWAFEAEPPATFEPSTISYVYCSTTRPAFISRSDFTYYANLLNPGGDWFGFNMSNYPIYWATCHNFIGPDFFSEEMTARAIRLGYPLNLDSDQIELNNVLEIMD